MPNTLPPVAAPPTRPKPYVAPAPSSFMQTSVAASPINQQVYVAPSQSLPPTNQQVYLASTPSMLASSPSSSLLSPTPVTNQNQFSIPPNYIRLPINNLYIFNRVNSDSNIYVIFRVDPITQIPDETIDFTKYNITVGQQNNPTILYTNGGFKFKAYVPVNNTFSLIGHFIDINDNIINISYYTTTIESNGIITSLTGLTGLTTNGTPISITQIINGQLSVIPLAGLHYLPSSYAPSSYTPSSYAPSSYAPS
jgi:hypothetical protein